MDLYTIQNVLNQGRSIFDLPLRCAFYARVSTDKEEQQNSLANQITYYTNFIASQKNWIYAEGYIDDGISGMSAEKRPGFIQMIADARAGKFDLIITKEISRFARNTVDSIQYTRELLKAGVGVYFQSDNINTLMPDAELRLTIMSSIAQEEIRKMSERIRFGHKKAIEDGKVLGNGQMWGYEKNNGKLVVVEDKAQMVRTLFQLYSQGKGFRTISRLLYEMGYTSKSGGPVSYSTLRYMIENPKYKGDYAGGKTVTVDYRTKQRKFLSKDKWIVHKNSDEIPQIVDENLWQKANDVLLHRSQQYSATGVTVSRKYSYSGLIWCGADQKPYWRTTIKRDGETAEAWQCSLYRQKGKKGCESPTVFSEELDIAVKNAVIDCCPRNFLLTEILLNLYVSLLDEKSREGDINRLDREIVGLRSKMARLIELTIEDDIVGQSIKNKIKSLDMQIALRLKTKNEILNGQKVKNEDGPIAEYLKNAWKNRNFCEILAHRFVKKIVMFRDDDLIKLILLRNNDTEYFYTYKTKK